MYIADWYDTRLSHVSPLDDWHKESGRIYRIVPTGSVPKFDMGDLHSIPAASLVELLRHPNKWVRQRAVLELGWRDELPVLEPLEEMLSNEGSLEALWAIHLLGALTDERAGRWLASENPHVRRWIVRLLGDHHRSIPGLAELARSETDVQVRSQLAATAKRLPPEAGLAIVRQLLTHADDVADPHLPLMIWWAVEAHADDWPLIEQLFSDAQVWRLPLTRQAVIGRLMQRYATAAGPEDLDHCRRLVELAADDASRELLLLGMLRAFQGRAIPELPASLAAELADYQRSLGSSGLVIALQQGSANAVADAVRVVNDPQQNLGLRIELTRALGETRDAAARTTLIQIARGHAEPALQRVALVALRNFDDPHIAENLVAQFGSSISAEHDLRDTACRTLATRGTWAKQLLREITDWRLKPTDLPLDVVQQLRAYTDPEIASLVEQAFGPPVSLSSQQKVAEMQRLKAVLATGTGDVESGQQHYKKMCAVCHQLFGEGNTIGPPLDAYDRGNPSFWLVALVEPSAEIREGYQSYAALTEDGRVVTGMIAAQDKNSVTIRTADNQLTTLVRQEIEVLQALASSLMPEDQLKQLSDQQIRDLFSYISQGAKR